MKQYDYIIVGAGSAGCVLAGELSSDPSISVLLVEDGSNGDDFLVTMPKGFGKLLTSPATAHFYPTINTREGLGGQEVWVRGRMLGGSSGVNGMVWNRGVAPDYDRLAELCGEQWSWAEMLPIFLGMEGDGASASSGPVTVKTHPAPSPLLQAWVKAGGQMGLPVKQDHRQGEQEGIGPLQWNIDHRGKRVSSARAYLTDARQRPNLEIVTGIRADHILLDGRRVTGIAGMRSDTQVEFHGKNVILSAGAIGSPRILQLSGIGPAETLKAAGVPVVLDNPHIGRHMREHSLVAMNFRLNSMRDSDNQAFSGWRLLANVARHALSGTGPMSFGSSEAAAYVKALSDSGRPDSQLMFAPYSLDPTKGMAMESEPGMQVYAMTLRPQSEGEISIASSDPAAPLHINPNFLSDEYDRRAAIAQFHYIRKLMSQAALTPYIAEETAFTASARSDEDILALYKGWGQAGYHATATVRMGNTHDAPLDGHLRLRGIEGLRVVDCSAFPEMIAGNTNAPTMALAKQAATLIRADR
ncbi:MAG: GMC family oxidoreductase [Sphingomonadaceae bacterium]